MTNINKNILENLSGDDAKKLMETIERQNMDKKLKQIDISNDRKDSRTPQKDSEGNLIIDPLNVNILGSDYAVIDGRLYKEMIDYDTQEVQRKLISGNAPVITEQVKDITNGNDADKVQWKTKNGIFTDVFPSDVLTQRTKIMSLRNKGLLVSDSNYLAMSNFIGDFLANYYQELPTSYRTSEIGNVRNVLNDENVFIIPFDEDNSDYQFYDNSPSSEQGYQEIYDTFKPKGTLEEYKTDVFDKVKHGEIALFAIYSSLASVLLHELNVSSFVIDIAGESSIGKTSTLKLCAGVWGVPQDNKFIRSWKATPVFIERYSTFMKNFPVLLDESSDVSNQKFLEDTVYAFSRGSSKGRGTKSGIAASKGHESILITTGESPILQREGIKKGATARVITISKRPFERDSELFEELFEGSEALVMQQYGHLGKHAYKLFQNNKEKYMKRHTELLKEYRKRGRDNPIIERLGTPFSVIHLAGEIINELFNETINIDAVVNAVYEDLKDTENNIYNTEKKELSALLEYLSDNRERHVQYSTESGDRFKDVWAYYNEELDELYLLATDTNKFLNDRNAHGGNVSQTIRNAWLREGYTTGTGTGRDGGGSKDTSRKRLSDGTQKSVIVITKETLDEFGVIFSKNLKENMTALELLQERVSEFDGSDIKVISERKDK